MIKNLLFDLGGVIMDIDRQRCVDAFTALGLKNADSYFGTYGQHGPFLQLERGDIDTDQFHEAFRPAMPAGTTDAMIDEAFCRFFIGIPTERLRALRRLRKQYKVDLLSNTNPIMWNSTIAEEFRKDGADIDAYFDGIVTSFRAKALKPEEKIFRHCESHLGIRPDETLFFDDSQANLDAAAALGFHTVLVRPGDEFEQLLAEYLSKN